MHGDILKMIYQYTSISLKAACVNILVMAVWPWIVFGIENPSPSLPSPPFPNPDWPSSSPTLSWGLWSHYFHKALCCNNRCGGGDILYWRCCIKPNLSCRFYRLHCGPSQSVIWGFICTQIKHESIPPPSLQMCFNRHESVCMLMKCSAGTELLINLEEIKFSDELEKWQIGPRLCTFGIGKNRISHVAGFKPCRVSLHPVRDNRTWKKCVGPISRVFRS